MREALAEHVPVVAGGGAADHAAVAVEQRFVAERVGVGDVVHFERDEAVRHAGGQLLLERLAPMNSPFSMRTNRVEARLERRVVARQVAAPHPVRLLDAQRFHRAHADHADAEFARRRQRSRRTGRSHTRSGNAAPSRARRRSSRAAHRRRWRSPTSMTCPVSHGKDALSSGASVSLASTSRACGPASTKQPRAPVTLRSMTEPSGRQAASAGSRSRSARPRRR